MPSPSPSLPDDAPPDLSLVIPTYNERHRIAELAVAALDVLEADGIRAELVIVDDNSPDGTGAIADALAARYPVRVIHRAGKLGLGSAVMAGFRAARAPVLGVMDADFSHPPQMIPRLLATLRELPVDAVVGSRYVPGGRAKDWPLARYAMSRLACLLAQPLTPVRDATSGFFLIRREAVEGVDIQAGGFKICLELLVRGSVRSVAEVPYEFVDRTVGASKMNLREALGYFTQIRQLLLMKLAGRGARPRVVRMPPS